MLVYQRVTLVGSSMAVDSPDATEMSIQGRQAPFVSVVVRLDTLILLEVLGAFVDGIVGQVAIHIGQMLLNKLREHQIFYTLG